MTSNVFSRIPLLLWGASGRSTPVSFVLRGSAGGLIVRVAANVLTFASQIVIARFLGVDSYSTYVVALAWMGVLILAGRLGFDLATIRFVAAYRSKEEWSLLRGFMRLSRFTVLVASTLIAAVFASAVWALDDRLGTTLATCLYLVSLIVPVFALVQVYAATVRGLGHVVMGDVPLAITQPAFLIAGVPLVFGVLAFRPSPQIVLGILIAATAVALAVLAIMRQRVMPAPARTAEPAYRRREWLTAAPAMILSAGFVIVLGQTTVLMLELLGDTTSAGLYGSASRLTSLLQLVVVSLISAVAPMAAGLYANGEHGDLQRIITIGTRVAFATTLAAAIVLAAGRDIFLSLFGEGFLTAGDAMLILILGQLAWAACAPASTLLNMTGHQNTSACILAGSILVNLTLCTILIPTYGLIGGAWATTLTMVVWNVITVLTVRKHLHLTAMATVSWPTRRRGDAAS